MKFKIMAVANVAAWVGMAIGVVGQHPSTDGNPYTYSIVAAVFTTVGGATLLGYWAGREDR